MSVVVVVTQGKRAVSFWFWRCCNAYPHILACCGCRDKPKPEICWAESNIRKIRSIQCK